MENLRFAEGEVYKKYNVPIDNIIMNNTHIKAEDVTVEDILEKIQGEPGKMIPAKRFVFDEGVIRGLLFSMLEATGQLKDLEEAVRSGGIINRPENRSFGGGMDIVIEYKKKFKLKSKKK